MGAVGGSGVGLLELVVCLAVVSANAKAAERDVHILGRAGGGLLDGVGSGCAGRAGRDI